MDILARLAIDPVEKKPLFHFLPGTKILSTATAGCNLHCQNCQNWQISQANPEDSTAAFCPPQKLVDVVKENRCLSLAYTYTEPIIYYEYTYDSAKLAKQTNIRTVLVTAGYINPEPWKRLLKYVDAANIDLKGITEEFYRDVCSATLRPVQNALLIAKASGVWVEVTNLVIPTLNDKAEHIRQLARWVRANLGAKRRCISLSSTRDIRCAICLQPRQKLWIWPEKSELAKGSITSTSEIYLARRAKPHFARTAKAR